MRTTVLTLMISLIAVGAAYGQLSPNDDCFTAIPLQNGINFCTSADDYTTLNATPSVSPSPSCWPQGSATNDVWFRFNPTKLGALIRLFGESNIAPNGLIQPSIAIYEGSCGNLIELACSSGETGANIRELTLTELLIGKTYYIRVDARNDNVGNFSLCIDLFNPVPNPEGDCEAIQNSGGAVILCDKSSFSVENLVGRGQLIENLSGTCIQEEFASSWYTWTVENSGSLTFSLTPNNFNDPEEDLDFAVFRMPNGLGDCSDLELVRCVASGETVGNSASQNAPCFGPTGLREGETDLSEAPGCASGDNNFVAPIDMIAGESYALVINNFSRSGFGFGIEFGGTGTFLGPQPNFEIEAVDRFECDKQIEFQDSSISDADDIVLYEWNFGDGATPDRVTSDVPSTSIAVTYESFGEKLVALTVTSAKGCITTKIKELFIEPCCDDLADIELNLVGTDLICAGVPSGEIEASADLGVGPYSYSLDGGPFQPSNIFNLLEAQTYQVEVQDIKGCTNMETVSLTEPPALLADAGEDKETDLGIPIGLLADYMPISADATFNWFPPDGLSCIDCLDPIATAPGTTEYTFTVTDRAGCTSSDRVRVTVEAVREIFAPNVIDLAPLTEENQWFRIRVGPHGELIERLDIYDRWGNRVYHEEALPVDPITEGWNGRINGSIANPGVYVWIAKVRYIDGEVLDQSGTLTILN